VGGACVKATATHHGSSQQRCDRQSGIRTNAQDAIESRERDAVAQRHRYCDIIIIIIIIKCVTRDVTVSDTLAQSYVHETSQTPGAAAEAAAERKRNKF